MKFEDIFKEEGLYIADSFTKGLAFKISKNSIDNRMELTVVSYNKPSIIIPDEIPLKIYDGLFNKTYKKVLNINELFQYTFVSLSLK